MTLYLHKRQGIVYEAAVFNGGEKNAEELVAWLKRNQATARWVAGPLEHILFGSVPCVAMALVGYYIIKGLDGVFIPLRPDSFHNTFEEYQNDFEHPVLSQKA